VSLSQDDACLSCPGSLDLGVLLPHLAGVIVEAVTAAAGLLLVTARARAPEAARQSRSIALTDCRAGKLVLLGLNGSELGGGTRT
jgi:hypothetical protein